MKEIKVLVGPISMLNLFPNTNENIDSICWVTVLPRINNFTGSQIILWLFFPALGQEEISEGQLLAQDSLTCS